MATEFEHAKHRSGLVLDLLERRLAVRITESIREVAEGILSGTIRSGITDYAYGNAETVEEYRKGLRMLLDAMPPHDVQLRIEGQGEPQVAQPYAGGQRQMRFLLALVHGGIPFHRS